MSLPKFDTNVDSYTLSELLTILGLDYPDPNSIATKTNDLINKYKKSDPSIATFFKDVQSQLIQYSSDLNDPENKDTAEYPAGKKQSKNWYQNEYLTQKDKTQTDKITDREQKIQVYGNEHDPMNREQLGVSNTYNVPIAQDKLNPKLENVTSRFINLDSQFRQSTSTGLSSSSDYTLDLSDYLPNVLSMKLYSYQIPFCWYVIDEAYGNTCFWITNEETNVVIAISSGNYSSSDFVNSLNNSFSLAGFTFPNTNPPNTPVSYNSNNGKITLNLINGVYAGNSSVSSYTITTNTKVTFFDYTAKLQCFNGDLCGSKGFYINQTLGWLMGFRVPFISVSENGNTAPAILDLNGTKYLILVIDDFNQNHINNGLVSISEYSNVLKMPSYYSPDLPYTCGQTTSNTTNLSTELSNYYSNSYYSNPVNTDIGLVLADKLNPGYIRYPKLLPSAPRTLTQSQIYTINEIQKNNDKTTNYRSKAPTSNDIFAILPIKSSGLSIGTLIVETTGSLQENKRIYFKLFSFICVKISWFFSKMFNL
jgi:hypothetical protein